MVGFEGAVVEGLVGVFGVVGFGGAEVVGAGLEAGVVGL